MVSRDPFIEVFVITAGLSLLLCTNLRVLCRPEKFTQKKISGKRLHWFSFV